MDTTLRNADLAQLATMLREQQARKVDVVAPATAIRSDRGRLVVAGTDPVLSDDGVTMADGTYDLLTTGLEGLAEKLRVPLPYMRRMAADRPDLFDANVNGWLLGAGWEATVLRNHGVEPMSTGDDDEPMATGDDDDSVPDARSFLLRCFADDETDVCRAVLSSSYRFIDHIDVLTAALAGVRDSGAEVEVVQCDLSDRRMYVKVAAPAVAAAAPALLANYRSPFSGETGADNPLVFAGFVLANSEIGGGAATITPQITVQICRNGMTMTKDVVRNVHLGGQLDHGVVRYSDETNQRQLRLIESQARDAAATFLDVAYVETKIAELTETAAAPVADPNATVEHVGKRLSYTDQQTADVLRRFIQGGDTTAGGVMHAVTAAAQDQALPDVAYAMEADAVPALELAAAFG